MTLFAPPMVVGFPAVVFVEVLGDRHPLLSGLDVDFGLIDFSGHLFSSCAI